MATRSAFLPAFIFFFFFFILILIGFLSFSPPTSTRWWSGENVLTGESGIFPANFTDGAEEDDAGPPPASLGTYICIETFDGEADDELTLCKGDNVEVTEKEWAGSDEWWIGTNLRSGETGAFPCGFVE